MQSLLEHIEMLATQCPLFYAGLTVIVVAAFALGFDRVMIWLSRAIGLDTTPHAHTQDRVKP